MTTPLLSVVIPTRDRARYAVHCLRTLGRIESPEIEIIVQDNNALADLAKQIATAGDARVRYEHHSGPLSVIDNCARAMARARGEYVTLLGDDDGVTGALLEVTRWAAAHDIDAVTPALIARYTWPDVHYAHYGTSYSGRLMVRPYTGEVRARDPDEGVRRSLREGFQDLPEGVTLPKLYYGIVRRRAVEALRREAGSVFPGVSPDMSAAMGLTRFVRRFVSLDHPVFLPGFSAPSTAGAHARKEHVGRLEDQPHLPRNCAATWPVEVPAIFAMQTVWAQSALAALRATGRGDLARDLDLGLLHAYCGVLNRGYWPAVLPSYWRAVAATGRSRATAWVQLGRGVARAWWLRFQYLVGRATRHPWYVGEHVRRDLANVDEAVMALDEWVASRAVTPGWKRRDASY